MKKQICEREVDGGKGSKRRASPSNRFFYGMGGRERPVPHTLVRPLSYGGGIVSTPPPFQNC